VIGRYEAADPASDLYRLPRQRNPTLESGDVDLTNAGSSWTTQNRAIRHKDYPPNAPALNVLVIAAEDEEPYVMGGRKRDAPEHLQNVAPARVMSGLPRSADARPADSLRASPRRRHPLRSLRLARTPQRPDHGALCHLANDPLKQATDFGRHIRSASSYAASEQAADKEEAEA